MINLHNNNFLKSIYEQIYFNNKLKIHVLPNNIKEFLNKKLYLEDQDGEGEPLIRVHSVGLMVFNSFFTFLNVHYEFKIKEEWFKIIKIFTFSNYPDLSSYNVRTPPDDATFFQAYYKNQDRIKKYVWIDYD
jgi:hypothetical protein